MDYREASEKNLISTGSLTAGKTSFSKKVQSIRFSARTLQDKSLASCDLNTFNLISDSIEEPNLPKILHINKLILQMLIFVQIADS